MKLGKLIAKANDLRRERVVTRWKDESGESIVIYLRELSAKEMEAWRKEAINTKTKEDEQEARAKLLARCICDENGEHVFDTYKEAVEVLNSKSNAEIERLTREALRINGVTQEQLEELEKN